MKINLLEHPELIRGAAELREEVSGVYPARFSHQLEWLPGDKFMNQCSAGIRLACRTDARSLAIKFQLGERCFEFGRGEFDLFIDGQGVQTFTPLPPWDQGQIFDLNYLLPEGEHELTLYFPTYRQAVVQSLEFAEATKVEALPLAKRKILFWGDSITQGYAATSSMCYAARLARGWAADYLNLGIGGGKFPAAIPAAFAQLQFDVAVVAFGVNDAMQLRYNADFRQAVRHCAATFAAHKRQVVMIQPLWCPKLNLRQNRKLAAFRQIIADEAAPYPQRILVVNGLDLVPSEVNLFPDLIHPNAQGMQYYAENLSRTMAPWLDW